jgi:hypothetical protein
MRKSTQKSCHRLVGLREDVILDPHTRRSSDQAILWWTQTNTVLSRCQTKHELYQKVQTWCWHIGRRTEIDALHVCCRRSDWHDSTITYESVYVTGQRKWIFVRMCNVQFKERILSQSVGSRSITKLHATKVLSSSRCTFKPSNLSGFFTHQQVYDLTREVIYI